MSWRYLRKCSNNVALSTILANEVLGFLERVKDIRICSKLIKVSIGLTPKLDAKIPSHS